MINHPNLNFEEMATHRAYPDKRAFYFTSFTCYRWLNLIELSEAYPSFHRWFQYLQSKGVHILAYVIMPNHFHGILYLPDECDKTINQLLANGKRFLAYDIVRGLEKQKRYDLLQELYHGTTDKEKKNGKKHRVFKTSSDIKELVTLEMVLTKLDYVHRNPCQGKWNLACDFTAYKHSSAAFYELEHENPFVTDYRNFF